MYKRSPRTTPAVRGKGRKNRFELSEEQKQEIREVSIQSHGPHPIGRTQSGEPSCARLACGLRAACATKLALLPGPQYLVACFGRRQVEKWSQNAHMMGGGLSLLRAVFARGSVSPSGITRRSEPCNTPPGYVAFHGFNLYNFASGQRSKVLKLYLELWVPWGGLDSCFLR